MSLIDTYLTSPAIKRPHLANVDSSSRLSIALTDTNGATAMIDDGVGEVHMIDPLHTRVHIGLMYTITNAFTNIQANTPVYIKMVTPNIEREFHVRFEWVVYGGAIIELFEDTVVTAASAIAANVNRKRYNNPVTYNTMTTTYGTTTPGTAGTLLEQKFYGGVTGTTPSAGRTGGSSQSLEWIFKPNSVYCFKILAQANGLNVGFECAVYEVNIT